MLSIRKGEPRDLAQIMSCIEAAKKFMRLHNNHNQWNNGYPSPDLIIKDIKLGQNYVGIDTSGEIVMTFAFIIGDNPTYSVIENGQWLNTYSYGTIHRLASNGKQNHIFKKCVEFCFTKINNIRLDTHADNIIMQHATLKLGFIFCGIIHLPDGSPRLAYQKSLIP